MSENVKILIIDDEEDLRENLKYVFEMSGYTVKLAEDGLVGLKVLEDFSPHLIILDLNMPNMGGIEFYQKICVRDVPKYPVFVLTARANMEKFFKDFNVDGFMAKPFEITDLVRDVSYVIHKKSIKREPNLGPRKVFVVENDVEFSSKIGMGLLTSGFTVNLAHSGAEAIERISKNIPDIVCVKMNLPDISGDIVIQKLKRMAKTSSIKSILYVHSVGENTEITDKIKGKEGVDKYVEASSEKTLIDAINDV